VAARREAEEETLQVELIEQFQVYSDPARSTPAHNQCCVFSNGDGRTCWDDAKGLEF